MITGRYVDVGAGRNECVERWGGLNMTILVTGGAGYIGSHMVHALVDAGERVVVLDDLSTGFDWAVAPAAKLVTGDSGDQTLVRALIAEHRIQLIIHFAASLSVPESVAEPLKYYRNNTANSRNLIECAVEGGVRHFIFSSTAAVYGNPARVPVTEDDPVAPISPYGSSKLMTETILRDASAACGLAYVILRYFNVAGADPQLRTGQSSRMATHLIKVAAETALGLRDKIEVFGTDYPTPDGTCIRDYIHVSDLVAAHADALAYLVRGGAPAKLRVWARVFRARGDRSGQARVRRRLSRRLWTAPDGRSGGDRRLPAARPRCPWLETAV